MLLWEIGHRKAPFQDRGALQAAFAVVQGERPPITLSGEFRRFAALIEDCWQHEPSARPTMAQVIEKTQVRRVGCVKPHAAEPLGAPLVRADTALGAWRLQGLDEEIGQQPLRNSSAQHLSSLLS